MNKQKKKEMEARAIREAEEKEKRIAAKKAKMTAEKKAAKKAEAKTQIEKAEESVEEDDADIRCIKD